MAELTDDNADNYDPFGKDVHVAQLIVSMKIYDALMALLTTRDADAAAALDDLHTNGKILGAGPQFAGFVAREG